MGGYEEEWKRQARANERESARQKKFAMWAIPIVVVSVGAASIYDQCEEEKPAPVYIEKYPYEGRDTAPAETAPAPSTDYVRPGPTCTKGCRCGNSCIDCSKTCRH